MNIKNYVQKINLKKLFFAIIGSFSSFLTETLITIFLTEILHIHYKISYATALSIGMIYIFQFHKKITFRSKRITSKSGIKFTTLYVLAYIANWILVTLIAHIINYILAIIIVNLILWPILFVGNDQWVFKQIKRQRRKRLKKQIKKMIPRIEP